AGRRDQARPFQESPRLAARARSSHRAPRNRRGHRQQRHGPRHRCGGLLPVSRGKIAGHALGVDGPPGWRPTPPQTSIRSNGWEGSLMAKQDESRRAFLKGAAAGAGAVATSALVGEAHAQEQRSTEATQSLPDGAKHGAFFNDQEAATVAALAERIMPGAPGKPGARDAGVLNYIDLALAGAYTDQQEFYRHGLAALEAHSRKTYSQSFVQLTAARQDEVITALEEAKAPSFTWPSARNFFETLRTHTMEGMFADPIYGGNKDFAGWTLVGFPGVQLTFTQADLQSRQAFIRAPATGLQAKAKGPARRT